MLQLLEQVPIGAGYINLTGKMEPSPIKQAVLGQECLLRSSRTHESCAPQSRAAVAECCRFLGWFWQGSLRVATESPEKGACLLSGPWDAPTTDWSMSVT